MIDFMRARAYRGSMTWTHQAASNYHLSDCRHYWIAEYSEGKFVADFRPTLRDWNGWRFVGLFSNLDKAKQACRDHTFSLDDL